MIARRVQARPFRWLGPWMLWLWVTCAGAVPAATPAPQDRSPWRVAILMAVDPSLPAAQEYDRALRAALQAQAPNGVTFFTEPLDVYRFPYADLAPEFLALARKKYAAQRVDVVVGVGEGALDFIRAHRREVWPGVPVVVTAPTEYLPRLGPTGPDTAAVGWRLDMDGTLDLVAALQPQARQLVVVGGASPIDIALTAEMRDRAALRQRWNVDVWTPSTVEDLRPRLGGLDASSAVVFTSMHRDSLGRATFPVDALAAFADASTAPVYGLYGPYVGRGVVGGRVVDFGAAGRAAADAAVGLLKRGGVPPVNALQAGFSVCRIDQTRLEALGIPLRLVPPGCELRNRPPSVWADHRGFVLGAAAVVLLQALTIAAMLAQRVRRRRAEAEAAQRRVELGRALRFAAMGELTASIAHEINQPLGAILSNADAAEMLIRNGTATLDDLGEILSDIRRDDLRVHEVIRRLRALLEKNEVEHVETRLHAAVSDVLGLLAPQARQRGVVIEQQLQAADDALLGDPVQLQQLLLNLALNAMDAMQDTEPGRRRLRVATAECGEMLVLTVADRGSGIEPAERAKVFESLYTTKPHGMGLGLPIVQAIVQAHGGTVDIEANPGGGAVFVVTLPRRLRAAARTGPGFVAPATQGLA